ncbi:MAG: alpha-amylase family glycosyl hydrolase [Bacteroidia bacterium]
MSHYSVANKDYKDIIFLTNHDQNRVMSELNNSFPKARIAATILLTLPGILYIYYGEEIGMRGMKPDEYIREPMLFYSEKN